MNNHPLLTSVAFQVPVSYRASTRVQDEKKSTAILTAYTIENLGILLNFVSQDTKNDKVETQGNGFVRRQMNTAAEGSSVMLTSVISLAMSLFQSGYNFETQ
jgi:hypothetical protein